MVFFSPAMSVVSVLWLDDCNNFFLTFVSRALMQLDHSSLWWKVLWCHPHLVWLIFGGSIPTRACFHSENFFVTLYIGLPTKKLKMLRFQICCGKTKYLSERYKNWTIKVGAAKLFSVNLSST